MIVHDRSLACVYWVGLCVHLSYGIHLVPYDIGSSSLSFPVLALPPIFFFLTTPILISIVFLSISTARLYRLHCTVPREGGLEQHGDQQL